MILPSISAFRLIQSESPEKWLIVLIIILVYYQISFFLIMRTTTLIYERVISYRNEFNQSEYFR